MVDRSNGIIAVDDSILIVDSTVYSMERAKRNLGPHKKPSDWAAKPVSTIKETTGESDGNSCGNKNFCRVTKASVTLFDDANSGRVRVFRDNTARLSCSYFNDNIYGDTLPNIPTVLTGCCNDWQALHSDSSNMKTVPLAKDGDEMKDATDTGSGENTTDTSANSNSTIVTWTSVKNLAKVAERYKTQLVSLDGGPSFARESLCSAKVTVVEYSRYCDNDADGDATPLYIFDYEFLEGTVFDQQQSTSGKNMTRTRGTNHNENKEDFHDNIDGEKMSLFSIPPCFSHDQMCYTNDRFRPLPPAWLLAGVQGSGTPIHNHPMTVAWNALLTGCKLWCCLSPDIVTEDILLLSHNDGTDDAMNGNSEGGAESTDDADDDFDLSALDWFQQCDYDSHTTNKKEKETTSALKDGDPHCFIIVQQPGEVVFVPKGWFHVVLNVETSIAISVSLTLRKDLVECMELLHATGDDEFATYWKKELGIPE